MSKFVVDELKASLQQEMRAVRDARIGAIRLRLYKHLSPAGTFTVNLIQNATTIGTKSLTSADIESMNTEGITASNYYHGYITFEFDVFSYLKRGVYTVELNSSGYVFSENAWIGWIKDHDRFNYPRNFSPVTDLTNPYTIEMWGSNA